MGHVGLLGCEAVPDVLTARRPYLLGLVCVAPVAGVMLTQGLPDGNVREEDSRIEGSLQP